MYAPGKPRIEWEWFTDKSARLTKLSTSEKFFDVNEIFEHPLGDIGTRSVQVTLRATVHYKLIERREEVETALQRNVDGAGDSERDKIGHFETLLRQFVREAIAEVVRDTYLVVLRYEHKAVGDRIKRAIDADGRVRTQLAIEIKEVHVTTDFVQPETPPPPDPDIPYIIYDGPADLAHGCQLQDRGGRFRDPVLEIPRYRCVIYLDENGEPHDHGSGWLPLSGRILGNPRTQLLILSTAPQKIDVPVDTKIDLTNPQGQHLGVFPLNTTVTLHYNVYPECAYKITTERARTMREKLSNDLAELCRELLSAAANMDILTNARRLNEVLRNGLRNHQPFTEQGLLVSDAWFGLIDTSQLPQLRRALPDKLMTYTQLQHLPIQNGYITVEAERVLLVADNGVVRMFPEGSHQQEQLGLYPTALVRLLKKSERFVDVEHTFKPLLPFDLVGDSLPAEITVRIQVSYRANMQRNDLQALWDLPENEERLRDKLRSRTKSALADAVRYTPLAFLRKDNDAIEQYVGERLQDQIDDGLVVQVTVEDIDHADEIWTALRAHLQGEVRLIETAYDVRIQVGRAMGDADAQREFEQRAPQPTLQALRNPNFFSDLMRAAMSIGDRSGSADEAIKIIERALDSFGKSRSGVTITVGGATIDAESVTGELRAPDSIPLPPLDPSPAPDPAPTTVPEVSHILDEHIEVCRALPGVRIPPRSGDQISVVIQFDEGPLRRVRLLLTDLSEYPYVEPILSNCQIFRAGYESPVLVEPRLRSLAEWSERSSLRDVIEEIRNRRDQLFSAL